MGFDAVGFAAAHLGRRRRARICARVPGARLSRRHGLAGRDRGAARRPARPCGRRRAASSCSASITGRRTTRSPPPTTRKPARSRSTPAAATTTTRSRSGSRRWRAGSPRAGRARLKVFVDTAPVMEKPLAQEAGLGWQGKHTNLVSRDFGSWLFLGEIYLSLALAARPARDRPLRRLPPLPRRLPDRGVPGALSARRAALHLVSDDRAQGPDPARAAAADRQPHLSAATIASRSARGTSSRARPTEPAFLPRAELTAPRLAELAALDDAGFRALFAGTAVKRIGRDRFVRNVLIAIGNAPEPDPRAGRGGGGPSRRRLAAGARDRGLGLCPPRAGGPASGSACGTTPTRWCGRNARRRTDTPTA